MKRLLLAVAILAACLFSLRPAPAPASGGIAFSGVAVYSPGLALDLASGWATVTVTETQHGVFSAGAHTEAARLFCKFEGYAVGSVLNEQSGSSGSCSGTGVSGLSVTKSCFRSMTRGFGYAWVSDSCDVTVGSSTARSVSAGNVVAHVPPAATDRYYYEGAAAEV